MAARLKLPKTISQGPVGQKNKKGLRFKFQINLRNILLFLLILFFVGPLFLSMLGGKYGESLPLPILIKDVKEGKVEQIKVSGDKLVVHYKDGVQKMAMKFK